MIIVKCNDKNIGEIECESMYQAHTWKIYLNANGYECEVLNNGESINLPINQNKMKNLERLLLPLAGIGAFELIKYLLS